MSPEPDGDAQPRDRQTSEAEEHRNQRLDKPATTACEMATVSLRSMNRKLVDEPQRRTDVQESQWLLKLHTYGLLRNSFHRLPRVASCGPLESRPRRVSLKAASQSSARSEWDGGARLVPFDRHQTASVTHVEKLPGELVD
jgi:hypothetical protein